ncbi:MAG: head-tail connector protein [Agriterribacter sp.]
MTDIFNIDCTEDSPTEPVTLEEAKAWLRIDGSDEDVIITEIIKSSRQGVEDYTNCSLVEKSIVCDVWLAASCLKDAFELPHGPVQGSPTVTQAGNTITDYPKVEGRFLKVYGLSGLHRISYNVGYETVPERLKQAVLNEIAYRYQNRGDQAKELMIGSTYICEAAISMCQEYKRMAWL